VWAGAWQRTFPAQRGGSVSVRVSPVDEVYDKDCG